MSFVYPYQLDMVLILEVCFILCLEKLLWLFKLFPHLIIETVARGLFYNLERHSEVWLRLRGLSRVGLTETLSHLLHNLGGWTFIQKRLTHKAFFDRIWLPIIFKPRCLSVCFWILVLFDCVYHILVYYLVSLKFELIKVKLEKFPHHFLCSMQIYCLHHDFNLLCHFCVEFEHFFEYLNGLLC